MFKLAGLLCITGALGLTGIAKSMALKERTVLLEDYLQMLTYLRSRINYFREPLCEILHAGAKNEDLKAFSFLNEILSNIDSNPFEIERIWAQKAEEFYRNTPLKHEDINLIVYTGRFIGQTDYENQCAQFEYLEKTLEKQISDAAQEYHRKGPLYRKIGFFAGGTVALVFI